MNPDDAATPWRKSSYSNTQANCVQTAQTHAGKIAIRDSKNPNGGTLTLTPQRLENLHRQDSHHCHYLRL
ncbi:MAG TPA: DUF397 domain-containing protein [Streptosporangiaceae bacterium]|jgi:hypothetical protein